MSAAQRFKLVNEQCEYVSKLIRDAQGAATLGDAMHLYRRARRQAEAVSVSVRHDLTRFVDGTDETPHFERPGLSPYGSAEKRIRVN